MAWTTHPRVAAIRKRNAAADVVVETLDGFRRHLTGRNGAVLTYYGFLTLFPLFLAASTILGFVLEQQPDLRDDLVDSAIAKVPFIGDQIAGGRISGSWIALVVGLAAALWGSMRAFVGLQIAYDDIWEIDVDDRANLLTTRVRALIGIGVIGVAQIGTVALGATVDRAGLPRLGQAALVLGGLAINVAVVGAMYRFLTAADVDWRTVWPGAAFTGTLYTALHFGGTAIATRIFESAETYGDFAGVLALLSWISLHAIVNLVGAELNAALARRERVRPTPSPAITPGG